MVTPVTGSQGWAAADRATADLGHAAQPSSSLQHSLFLSAAKHTWAHSRHPLHLCAPNISAEIKGCQLDGRQRPISLNIIIQRNS